MEKLYAAYGSNLNMAQMLQRCPDAKYVGVGKLLNYQLLFCRVATIIPRSGSSVPVGVWKISADDEKHLDLYEGFPHCYRKETLSCLLSNKKAVSAMVYIMNSIYESPPSPQYFRTIFRGYQDFRINTHPLTNALKRSKRDILKKEQIFY